MNDKKAWQYEGDSKDQTYILCFTIASPSQMAHCRMITTTKHVIYQE